MGVVPPPLPPPFRLELKETKKTLHLSMNRFILQAFCDRGAKFFSCKRSGTFDANSPALLIDPLSPLHLQQAAELNQESQTEPFWNRVGPQKITIENCSSFFWSVVENSRAYIVHASGTTCLKSLKTAKKLVWGSSKIHDRKLFTLLDGRIKRSKFPLFRCSTIFNIFVNLFFFINLQK